MPFPSFKTAWKRNGRAAAFTAVICGIVYGACFSLRAAGKLEFLELKAYDLAVRSGAGRRTDRGDLVLVGIDEGDIRFLHHYPLTDHDKADLLGRLAACGARAVGVDLYLDLPAADDAGVGRAELDAVLRQNRNIICGEYWGDAQFDEPAIPPPPVLKPGGRVAGRRVGCVDQPLDRDDIVRRGLLYLSHEPAAGAEALPGGEKPAEPSLSLNVANRFLESDGTLQPDPKDPIHLVQFWSARVPRLRPDDGPYVRELVGGYQYLVRYDGQAHFKTYSLREVLDGSAGAAAFAGKAVLVGMTAESVKDKVNTPLGIEQYGAEQQARLTDQLIDVARGRGPIRVLPNLGGAGWALLWTAAAGAAGWRLRSLNQLVVVAAAGQAVLLFVAAAAFRAGWWAPVVVPSICWLAALAGVTAYRVQLERADRATLMDLFGRAVQKEVADEMWLRRDELLEGGGLRPRETVATLLFTDLRGFTSLSEGMKPADLIRWLNAYLDAMAEVAVARGGVVAKYMGDGIMVAFGVPLGRSPARDAREAVACALDMRRAMDDLRRRWQRAGEPDPMMRVGVHTGPVIAGSVGSARRSEYTTLGDTTNVASRLESYDKELMDEEVAAGGCRILISAATYEHVADAVRVRLIKQARLTGRAGVVTIYAVLGPAGAPEAAGPAPEANPGNAAAPAGVT